jgi:5-deoxy-glucuronate isomerase
MTDEPIVVSERAGTSPPLLRRAALPDSTGRIVAVDPASAGWTYLGLAVHRLRPDQSLHRVPDDREVLVLVLEGRAGVRAGERDFGVIGSRASVFDGPPPPVVLAGPLTPIEVIARSEALIAVASAPAGPVQRTALIGPAEIRIETRGSGRTERRVHHLLPPEVDAGRLIVFETFTPGGNWSSYPPHKHDTEDPPNEAQLEEIYFYRFAAPAGFAFQRVYTPDRAIDESLAPGDGDLVLVPAGYHPVAAAPGYACYYLSVMAGPNRTWNITVDPDHARLTDRVATTPSTASEEAST